MALETLEHNVVMAPDHERATMRVLEAALGSRSPQALAVRLTATIHAPSGDETRLELPDTVVRLVATIAGVLARGEAVSIVPIQKELTTQEAADFLNISRQYLVRLLDRGDIPHYKVGTHRRVRFSDLLEYRNRRDAQRLATIDRLDQMSQEMGVYE